MSPNPIEFLLTDRSGGTGWFGVVVKTTALEIL